MKTMLQSVPAVCMAAFALALFTATPVSANAISYLVNVNTSAISGTTGWLDFQFNPGDSTTQAAHVNIEGFATDGTLITALDSPQVLGGATGGPLPGFLSIDNSTALNDYFQQFIFGNAFSFTLTFDGPALVSPNGAATSGSTFGLTLFDEAVTSTLLTTDPFGTVATVQVNLDGTTTPQVFPSDVNGAAPAASITAVPEPGSVLLLGTGLAVLGFAGWRRKK